MVKLIARGRSRYYQDCLDIPAGFEWVSSCLLALLKRELDSTFPFWIIQVDTVAPSQYVLYYDVVQPVEGTTAEILRGDEVIPGQLIASFQVQGLGPERTRVSSLLAGYEANPWDMHQYGPGDSDYDQGSYLDIWTEIRQLWPGTAPSMQVAAIASVGNSTGMNTLHPANQEPGVARAGAMPITKENLLLLTNKKLTQEEMASEMRCNRSTISRKLREYGIPAVYKVGESRQRRRG